MTIGGKMNTLSRIIDTELEYLKCFSDFNDEGNIIRFSDDIIPDMYSHNLTYLKQPISGKEFCDFVEKEIEEARKKGKNFLNLQFDFENESVNDYNKQSNWEVTIYDYYQFPIQQLDKLIARQDCTIRKLNDEQVDKALEFDIRVNGEDLGKSFIRRRFERRSRVYLAEGLVDSYLCYFNGEIIGHCDLFLNDEVAKIEDFDVAPEMQRKGFGTAILKEMVLIARAQGAEVVYLITDNDDTAKEMYKKCGMIKVGEKRELIFNF